MSLITVDQFNIDREHICCAIAGKKGDCRAESKKAWMKEQFENGLTFTKLDERGKVFIEYLPAEYAFAPIEAEDYMYINCFWVSGRFKGKGHGSDLLEACIRDSKARGKKGLVVISSTKKKPFLSDSKYLKHKGFKVADSAEPYYELLYLPFEEGANLPIFKDQAKRALIDEEGIIIYYTNQCPHTSMYVRIVEELAKRENISLKTYKLKSYQEAQECSSPFTSYSIYKNGQFITNEILTEKKFIELATRE